MQKIHFHPNPALQEQFDDELSFSGNVIEVYPQIFILEG